jgi:hypothetical protein
MKMSDILRSIADELESREKPELPGNVEKSADKFLHKVGKVPHEDESDSTSMIPPLQQKIEILKKAAGEPNAFDAQDKLTGQGERDELDDIKKIAGLTVMIDGPQGEMG